MAATHTRQPSLVDMAGDAVPQPYRPPRGEPSWLSWMHRSHLGLRWLGDSNFSHFSHLLWLRHRDGSHPPEPWLVVIRWQPMAAVPRGRGRQARSHLCVWRGRRTAAIELSPAMLRRMAALTVPQP